MICGVTGIACMLLDVLGGFDEVKLCTGYRLPDGTITDRFLPDAQDLAEVEPVYETMPGWGGDRRRDRVPGGSAGERPLGYLDASPPSSAFRSRS